MAPLLDQMLAVGEAIETDPHSTDPPLLRDHSQLKSYKTSRFEYPDIRVFFRQHAKAAQLPQSPAPLPLLVCIPGLGGSVAQFYPLLNSLVDLAPCLAIDHPGGGRSRYAVTPWDAYTQESLVELLEMIIEDHRDKESNQGVILIGHSMGTALAASLANTKTPHKTELAEHVMGLVAICPASGPFDERKSTILRRLLWVPGWIFSLWRAWDGMGGPHSPSVSRFVGEGAEPQLRVMQYRFNQQSRTPVWRRMAYGALPVFQDGKPMGGIPGLDTWAGLEIPVFLIAGENDHLTPPTEMEKIAKVLQQDGTVVEQPASKSSSVVTPASNVSSTIQLPNELQNTDGSKTAETEQGEQSDDEPSTPLESLTSIPAQPDHPTKVVQSIIISGPANHALLYMPRLSRVLAGLISGFLSSNITERLSLAWQLQYLSREGKWDVKNLNKWKSVAPVSDLIGPEGHPIFRAMKTLREADDIHCPKEFVQNWGNVIKDVIDISKDQPVYDPRGLDQAGVHYHKFPTVSKIPPDAQEVDSFIRLVDTLRAAQRDRAEAEKWERPAECVIGVHCHYGFNRTGYFMVCYLVERCDFSLQDAIDAFALARPNGIRHSHFLDQLYVRYNIENSSDNRDAA